MTFSRVLLCSLLLVPLAALADHGEDPGVYFDVVADPIAFTAISGAAATRDGHEQFIWVVSDQGLSPSRIQVLDLDGFGVTSQIFLSRDGLPVSYDLEGIDEDPSGGWWCVSEGAGTWPKVTSPNLLLRIDPDGAITDQIPLPAAVTTFQVKYGLEGVAVDDTGTYVYVAFQTEWLDDPSGLIRIGRYAVDSGEWAFYHYPRDTSSGRVNLSDLSWAGDGQLVVLERDNLVDGEDKRLYVVHVTDVEPAPAGSPPPVLDKWLLRDMVEVDGWPYEKAESLALVHHDIYVINDNDAIEGAPTQVLVLDKLAKLLPWPR